MGLTIGVWGTDHPHAGGHLAALKATARIDKLLIWDADPTRAHAAAADCAGAEAIPDVAALLEPGAVDAIVMLLATREAGAATCRALEAGVYVYGDKPGALTPAEMRAIVAVADRTGAHLCPCYAWRVDPTGREIKRLLDDGVLGDVWSFQGTWLTSQVALRGPANWLFHRAVSGGGILAWLACHWIDLLSHLLGPATVVSAMVATQCGEAIDVEDTASVVMRLGSGAIGVVRAGYSHKPFSGYDDQDLHLSFEGSRGSLYWPLGKREGYRLRTGHPAYAGLSKRWVKLEKDPPVGGGYSPDFLDAFLQSVVDRSAPPATERDALYVLEVLEAAYRSSEEGRHVAVTAGA